MDKSRIYWRSLEASAMSIFFQNLGSWRIDTIRERTSIRSLPWNGKMYFSTIVLYVRQTQR